MDTLSRAEVIVALPKSTFKGALHILPPKDTPSNPQYSLLTTRTTYISG